MNNLIFKQKGIGLIEVLVALVIVSLGLLSLAAFQGQLLSSSGQNKARAEAVSIAEHKLEDFRDNIQSSDYAAIQSSLANQVITGTNATYNVSWTVVTNSTPAATKTVTVNVAWLNNHVSLSTNVAWADPSRTIEYATGGNGTSGLAPSPNNDSSYVSARVFVNSDGTPKTGTPLNDGSGLATIKDGNDIYLIDPTTGVAKIKFTGGVIHTIKGTVYAENSDGTVEATDRYPVAFSDLGYCEFPVPGTRGQYICYFGGDCSHGGYGCPVSGSYADINGGWYGKVGLLETSTSNFQNKKVCFAEDINGTGINTITTTARSYATRRVDGFNNAINSEGLNQSMACQNFLVVNKSGSSYPCGTVARNNGLNIVASSVLRVLGYTNGVKDPNVSLADDTSQCSSVDTLHDYVVTGNIYGNYAGDVTVTLGGQQCRIDKSSGGQYSYYCEIQSNAGAPDLVAYGGSVSPAKVTKVNTGTTQDLTTGTTVLPNTSYVINGNLLGNQANNVAVALSGGTCSTDYTADTYSCQITTSSSSVTITATNTGTGNVVPSSATVSLNGTSPVTGPDFTGSTVVTATTYTISGPITGSHTNKISVSVSDGGSCSISTSGGSTTYKCTVSTANSSVTLSASTSQNGGTVTPSTIVVPVDPSSTTVNESTAFVGS